MSILIHAPSQVRYGSRHVHPHPHSTQPPPSYDAKQLLREEEDFARSHLSREVIFREKKLSRESIFPRRMLDSSQSTRDIELCYSKVELCAPSPTCITPQKNERWGVRGSQVYPEYRVISAAPLQRIFFANVFTSLRFSLQTICARTNANKDLRMFTSTT